LSDGPSIWNHRITKTNFRSCSTCRSHSQAGLCLCTHRLVSNQPEPTLVRLRYIFGGDRPSQTTHQTMSSIPIKGPELEPQNNKGGISRSALRQLAPTLHSLPPILHMIFRSSLSSYSKGSGRNLPDKEFRYLRTVIVTAAVYWGFGSMLLLVSLNNISP